MAQAYLGLDTRLLRSFDERSRFSELRVVPCQVALHGGDARSERRQVLLGRDDAQQRGEYRIFS